MAGAPDPTQLHPVSGQERVVFLRALVTDPRIEAGEYSYYDDPTTRSGSSATPSCTRTGPSGW